MRHVIHCDPEPGGLVRAVETAPAYRQKLERMAIVAREPVLRYHTPRALVDHVIECGLAVKKS
jgi:hypothetical protein